VPSVATEIVRLTDQPLTRPGAITSQQRDATRRAVRGGSAAGPSNGARSGAEAELYGPQALLLTHSSCLPPHLAATPPRRHGNLLF
jgi:hypothetical protein